MIKKSHLPFFAMFLLLSAVGVFVFLNVARAGSARSININLASSQYLSVADNSALDITSDITLEAWIKPTSQPTTGSDNRFIVAKWDPNGNQRAYALKYSNEDGPNELHFLVSDNGSRFEIYKVAQTFNTGTWYHVAAVWNAASSTATFYVNGVSVGSQTKDYTSINNSSASLAIGSHSGGINWFDGLIDDVRVSRDQRTAAEIYASYDEELRGDEDNLAGYWKLNSTLTDQTSNQNHLTNNNAATFSADIPSPTQLATIHGATAVRKSNNLSRTTDSLSEDNDFKFSVATSTSYVIDGLLLLAASSTVPDAKIRFSAPSGSEVDIGYIAAGTSSVYAGALSNDETSATIELPANEPIVVQVKGTIRTGSSSGTFKLEWAQAVADSANTSLLKGSYIRID